MSQKTWEQSEIQLQKMAFEALLEKTQQSRENIGAVISGDLLNQCISSSSSLRNMNIPHLGLYGACSTMAESLLIGAMAVNGGYYENVVAITSSHFASSERQFRFPLDYGGQRPPTSQWTVTGSGAILLGNTGNGPKITACTTGTVVDLGITDANNMGAAMAPAAFSTIQAHFADLNENLDDFDLVVTGDLGTVGVEALIKLSKTNGIDLSGKIFDCGVEIFDSNTQDVHAGGSGCGCSAAALCGRLLDLLNTGKLKRILFCGTGALLSPTSVQQGLSIPGICHAVAIEGV
jgi:stage V sporulation protein AD